MASHRSAVGDVDAGRFRFDAGGVIVAVGLRVSFGALGVDKSAAGEGAVEWGRGAGTEEFVAVDGVACTNARSTRVLVLNIGQCTRKCVCRLKTMNLILLLPICVKDKRHGLL